jgi:Flp pilus assembly protein TadG
MRRPSNKARRRGVHIVEMSLIAMILAFLLLGFIVLGEGVSYYQRVAAAARDGSRWASVHGMQYQRDTGNAAATAADVYQQAIAPKLAGLDPSALTYSVSWNTSNEPFHTVLDASNNIVKVRNIVTVQVSYQWSPTSLFKKTTLSTTSSTPMSN